MLVRNALVHCNAFDNYRIKGDVEMKDATMKSLNMKLVLSAVGIVAMLTGPAFAKKQHQVSNVNASGVYNTIPGYDRDGSVVGIPDPDHSGAESQR